MKKFKIELGLLVKQMVSKSYFEGDFVMLITEGIRLLIPYGG